jgi:acyl-CoA synthetase (NDP forming)
LFNNARIPISVPGKRGRRLLLPGLGYNRNQRLPLQTPSRLTGARNRPTPGARLIIEGVLTEQRKVLTEPESIAVLRAFHIPAVQNAVAHSPNEALIIAQSIGADRDESPVHEHLAQVGRRRRAPEHQLGAGGARRPPRPAEQVAPGCPAPSRASPSRRCTAVPTAGS